jgi:hypothetical protein
MNYLIKSLLLILSLTSSVFLFAQEDNYLETLPETKEDFIKSEKALLNTIDWLAKNPVGQNEGLRKKFSAILTAWAINSPTVTIEVNANVLTFTDKNPDLLISFMAGYVKYSLEHSYSSDIEQGSLAGIRSAIALYKLGEGIKKDPKVEKLIALDEKQQLETWVKTQILKKPK